MFHLLLKWLFLILLFVFRKKSSNFNRSRLVFLQMACSVSGWMFALLDDRMWVEWIPALARGHRLLRARGQLAATPRAVHFRTFPVEMPLVVCTRPKRQAG